jgi:hypothetical protein
MFYIIHKERLVDKRVLKEALLVQRFRRGTRDGGRGTGVLYNAQVVPMTGGRAYAIYENQLSERTPV